MKLISDENLSKVKEALETLVMELGYELVELKTYAEYGESVLELLIWKKDGVSLDDCEKVHQFVSDLLDQFDEEFLTPYVLKISSMGLDRPILSPDDFRRALNTEIEFKEGKAKRHGVLVGYDENCITVKINDIDKQFLKNNITKVQPYVRF